ncbi:hypothetical protein [Catenulispora subtropica]|uniref:hypothetical protein n=1 Tax=Catenulispora subtropica TaxID=450798 RepID=UPI0031E0F6E5
MALYDAVTMDEVWTLMEAQSARSLVFDVEPLVAIWGTDTVTLDSGVVETLRRLGRVPGREVVLFSTNSARRPTVLPGLPDARVGYRSSAVKPLRTKEYRDLPRPGLVVGDQLATDGALAWRLGFDFVHYHPPRDWIPPGPRLMMALGELLRPLLFRAA